MEAIATGLAVESAKAITKVVAASAFEEIKLVWGFNDQLQKLKNKFRYIQAFMNDLEKGKHEQKSELVNAWLEDVKDVASTAENLLDDYQYEMLRRKIELKTNRPSLKKKCSHYLKPSTCPVVFRLRMTHRVKRILSELDELEKQANNIGLQQVQLTREAASASTFADRHMDSLYQARKHAGAIGSDFIGREDDKKQLLQKLLNNPTTTEDGLSIIAIVGIGGLGKTTLARQLFEHAEVDEHFGKEKVWICVSEAFNVKRILKEMVESLTLAKCDLTNIGAIINKLGEALKRKKFFLVLDDVWNDNKELWNSFKTELHRISGLTRSVILITTRSNGVATEACASCLHKLKGLSIKEGWALLKQQVLDEKLLYDSSGDDIGMRIVEKCKGVPLAIKSMGRLLQTKQHRFDWKSIESSELWNIKDVDKNSIMPSLLLSYNNIDCAYVKQCFAYCAIFPKDSIMEKSQLISMWLAQGLLHDEFEANTSFAEVETIGEDFITFLVNYSFFEEENEEKQTRYKMHDLVHDLATYVIRKDLLVLKTGDKLENANVHTRHLAFNLEESEITLETVTKDKMQKLRTINFWHGLQSWDFSSCARYVRTLVMVDVGLTKVPSVIGKLVHLRYLDLSGNNKIAALPDSICKLYQLQTLRLLRCDGLGELPRELHMLEKVRHLVTSYPMFASSGLGKLTSLQTLPCLKLRDEEGWTIDELGPLSQVKGDVRIKGLEHVKNSEDATKADLGRKDKIMKLELSWGSHSESNTPSITQRCRQFNILYSLTNNTQLLPSLHYGGSNNDEEVLNGLEPNPSIRSLSINGFKGVRFPEWVRRMSVKQSGHPTQLSHLREVNLISCKRWQQLPSLGQLPSLTILRLYEFDKVESIGIEFFYENSSSEVDITARKELFPSLRKLYIENFKSLTTWMAPSSATAATMFPKLETLEIKDCRLLERVPVLHLESLKNLQLRNVGDKQALDMMKGSYGLTWLTVRGIRELERLPEEVSNCRNLQTLSIRECGKVKMIPSGIISLKKLTVWNCPSLGSIEDGVLQGLSSLRELEIRNCSGLKRMTKTLEDCTCLEKLTIYECPSIQVEDEEVVAMPNIGKLQGLTLLELRNAGGMMAHSPRWISHLHRLTILRISGWGENWDMSFTRTLFSLTYLYLREFPNMKPLAPESQHLLPPSLKVLKIDEFKDMEAVPDWLGGLSSLQELYLYNSIKLKYLPSQPAISRLTRLRALYISRCPQLAERCDKHNNNGPESQWPKISHLPQINIHGINVQTHR